MNAATQRNLAWKLNWWRQSELEGALLLGRMVGMAEDGELAAKLVRHSAEEAEHSRMWADVLAELELPHIRIFRSYQSFYLQHSGPPGRLLEVLAFTRIFELRVHARFSDELHRRETPEPARLAYRQMIHEEKGHLAWVAAWLRGQPEAAGALARYRAIDRAVFAELAPYGSRLWEVPGLGREHVPSPTLSLKTSNP